MKSQWICAAALGWQALHPMACEAAAASATMEVGFRVVEACSIDASGARPQVTCAHGTPYLLARQDGPAPAVPTSAAAAQPSAAGAPPVLTISF